MKPIEGGNEKLRRGTEDSPLTTSGRGAESTMLGAEGGNWSKTT